MVLQSLAGLPAFLAYFGVAVVAVIVYLFIYTRFTPQDEFQLIASNVPGAAVALGMSLLGFALPVASAVAHAANIVDCAIWSVVALIVQIIAFFLARIFVPNLPQRISDGEMAAAVWVGFVSVAAGLLSAASMTY